MGRFILSPDKFNTLEEDAQHCQAIHSLKKTGDYSGIITTDDVTLDFNYDLGTQTLNFNIGKKHSLAAHIAGDNVIERHITDMLFNLTGGIDNKGTSTAKRLDTVTDEEKNVGQQGNIQNQLKEQAKTTNENNAKPAPAPLVSVKKPIPQQSTTLQQEIKDQKPQDNNSDSTTQSPEQMQKDIEQQEQKAS